MISAPLSPQDESVLLAVGEWQSFVGYELTFYGNGRVTYANGRAREAISHLSPAELSDLKRFLGSPEFDAALVELRGNGYEPGCCDVREVAFMVGDESLGFPVCDDRVVGEALAHLIDLLNEIGGRHFGHLRKNPIPKRTCD